MDAESQLLADLDAENTRLKALITELADALDVERGPIEPGSTCHCRVCSVLQRAREAVK